MDKIDQILVRTATEIRDTAPSPSLNPLPPVRRKAGTKVVAFAMAFALVAIAVGVVPSLIGSGDPVAEPTVPTPQTTVATPDTTVATSIPRDCSASGIPTPGAWRGPADAPAVVVAKWQALVAAVSTCDFDGLEALASPTFSVLFGSYGVDQFRKWEEEGEPQMGTLLHLLSMTPAVIDYSHAPGVPDHYVWPAAFAYDNWQDVPAELVEELHAIYTEGELDEYFGTFGAYAGWRTSITESGDWMFYTSGD